MGIDEKHGKQQEKSKRKHLWWFDLRFTYEEIGALEKARGHRTQMEYVEEAVREKLAKEAKH